MSAVSFVKKASKYCTTYAKNLRHLSTSNEKISYYHENGRFSLLQSTLGDMVDEAADDCGDNIGVTYPFQRIAKTFNQFKEETDQLASGLTSLKLEVGDRIGICGPNSYEWLLTQYAASKAGLTAVTLNPASTEKELAYTLNKVGCRAIVTPLSFRKKDYYKTLCATIPELPTSHPGQINSQRLKSLQNVIIIGDEVLPGTFRLKDLMDADDSASRQLLSEARRRTQSDQLAIIMFTSGTTGAPKAATLSHFQIVNLTRSFLRRAKFDDEKPVICIQVPLFHVMGCSVAVPSAFLSRGRCVFPSEHFDPVSSLKTVEEEKCNVIYGVPTMFHEILKQLRGKQRNIFKQGVKAIIGGSPLPLEMARILQDEFGLIVMNIYGSTETSGPLSAQSPLDSQRTFGSAGKPLEFVEVKLVDSDGNVVLANQSGEVLSRSPFIFSGYWDDAQKTAEVVDPNRWYRTGDIGTMDQEGNIYITGRIKDMIIRGGENIYPTEVENFLMTHPAVDDVCVVGVPDQRLGEELCASIKLKPDSAMTPEGIKDFCKDKISYFKVPRYILFEEDYPKTESGKIMKSKLREDCMRRLNL